MSATKRFNACQAAACLLLATSFVSARGAPVVLVVVGAPGAEEYAEPFSDWAEAWRDAAATAGAEFRSVGLESEAGDDRDRLWEEVDALAGETEEPAWIVLIGHGTFDGTEAKFNLEGPDVSAASLAEHLQPATRPIAIINCASSSAPFINALSAENRVVITATRSGFESNYARFGGRMAEAIADLASDVDKDDQVSLLEAFLVASRRTAEFYEQEARLATEHALLDDNGDGLGTPADWFRGVRATRRATEDAERDGLRAHQLHLIRSEREQQFTPEQRAQRDQLEADLEALRERKSELGEAAYLDELQAILVDLAQIYDEAEQLALVEESVVAEPPASPTTDAADNGDPQELPPESPSPSPDDAPQA